MVSEEKQIRPSNALVIFFIPSGDMCPDGILGPHTKARCDKAANEYTQAQPDYFFCSGNCYKNELVAEKMASYLEKRGIPGSRIRIDRAAWGTWENVKGVTEFVRKLISEEQPSLVILYVFSQRRHLRRIGHLLDLRFAQGGLVQVELREVKGKESFLEIMKFWLTIRDPWGRSFIVRFERWYRRRRAFR